MPTEPIGLPQRQDAIDPNSPEYREQLPPPEAPNTDSFLHKLSPPQRTDLTDMQQMTQDVWGDYRLAGPAEGTKITDEITLFKSTDHPDLQFIVETDPATGNETLYRVEEYEAEEGTYTALYRFDQTSGQWTAEKALSGGIDQISGDSTLYHIFSPSEVGFTDAAAGEEEGIAPFLQEVATLNELSETPPVGETPLDVSAAVPDLPDDASVQENWAENRFGDWRIGSAQFEGHLDNGVSLYSHPDFPDVKFLRVEQGDQVVFLQMEQTLSAGNLPEVELSLATPNGYKLIGEFSGSAEDFLAINSEINAFSVDSIAESLGGALGAEFDAWLAGAESFNAFEAGFYGFLRTAAFTLSESI
jgi:hypothetical protein